MDKEQVLQFRQLLADQGNECTVEEATQKLKLITNFIKQMKRISQEEIWDLREEIIEQLGEEDGEDLFQIMLSGKDF